MVPSAANFGDEEGPTRFARVAGRESEQAPLFLPPPAPPFFFHPAKASSSFSIAQNYSALITCGRAGDAAI